MAYNAERVCIRMHFYEKRCNLWAIQAIAVLSEALRKSYTVVSAICLCAISAIYHEIY